MILILEPQGAALFLLNTFAKIALFTVQITKCPILIHAMWGSPAWQGRV